MFFMMTMAMNWHSDEFLKLQLSKVQISAAQRRLLMQTFYYPPGSTFDVGICGDVFPAGARCSVSASSAGSVWFYYASCDLDDAM